MATLFPPILAASQPAFVSANSFKIYFTMPELVSTSSIGHLQIKITYQSNGRSVANTSRYPDGIIYKRADEMALQKGEINISSKEDLENGNNLKTDTYYKVQIRFGSDKNLTWLDEQSTVKFFDWKTQQITNNQTTFQVFGEWSTIMVLKCIDKPIIAITSEQTSGSGGVQFDSTVRAVDTIVPKFSGYYRCTSNEPVDKYRFQVYTGQSIDETDLFVDSGWLQHDSSKENLLLDYDWIQQHKIEETDASYQVLSIDEHRFNQAFEEGKQYTLVYSVITKNGYEGSSKPDYFEVVLSRLNKITGMSLTVYDHSNPMTNEEGCMVLEIGFEGATTGNFVIMRTDEFSDYKYWEDLNYFVISDNKTTLYKTDYTIESGIKYKYAIVKENSVGYRSVPLMEKDAPARWVNFQYNYLLSEKGHIRLMYDNTIPSFKKNVSQNKQDTLGGKYPTITKNGYAYYTEFQVEGLISVEQEITDYIDADGFKFKAGDCLVGADKICFSAYSKDNYFHRADDSDEVGEVFTYQVNNLENINNLTDDYYFVERKYREIIIDFLNDGKYKLYKSPTEGNILVVLTDVSLTPKEELGRLVYSFSATATEVDEPSLKNLDEFGLIDIGEFYEQIGDVQCVCGQISGIFTEKENIFQAIVNDAHRQIGDSDYEYQFRNLKAISFDTYPHLNFVEEASSYVNEINNYKSKLQTGELTEYQQAKIQKQIDALQEKVDVLNNLNMEMDRNTYYQSLAVKIDGNEIRVQPNRIYNLDNLYMTDSHEIYAIPHIIGKDIFYTPMVINYTARVITTEALARTVIKKDSLTVWGQIGGIFETNKTILNNYNPLRIKTDCRVYNEEKPLDTPDNKYNMENSKNYLVIQTTDIFSGIKQLCKEQAEKAYNTSFSNYDEDNDTYNDGYRYYIFEYISKLDIEADEGTVLYIKNKKGEYPIRIGATERYVITDLRADDIQGLRFEENSKNYALINYTCKTTVTTMGNALAIGG